MSDPHEKAGMSVTLKQDGKDGTWLVFHGSPSKVSEQICETFGFDIEKYDGLHDLVLEATRTYKAVGNTGRTLGARIVKDKGEAKTDTGSAWDEARQRKDGPPWDEKSEPERNPLFEQVEALTDLGDHKKLWAENRSDFDSDADLLEAWKAKGRALRDG